MNTPHEYSWRAKTLLTCQVIAQTLLDLVPLLPAPLGFLLETVGNTSHAAD